jgi:hypothetical protein
MRIGMEAPVFGSPRSLQPRLLATIQNRPMNLVESGYFGTILTSTFHG